MNISRMYGLFLRHFFLITRSFPRILDLIYWPTIQITLWGFISNFFSTYSSYYNNTVGIILTAAILYDFLFRSSISYNIMFLEEQVARPTVSRRWRRRDPHQSRQLAHRRTHRRM